MQTSCQNAVSSIRIWSCLRGTLDQEDGFEKRTTTCPQCVRVCKSVRVRTRVYRRLYRLVFKSLSCTRRTPKFGHNFWYLIN